MPFGPEIETAPSMSFRTMLPTAPALPFIKLPVAIWMTSEMRSLGLNPFTWGRVLVRLLRISRMWSKVLTASSTFSGKMPHGTFVIKIVWMTLRVSFSPSCFVVRMRGQETIIHWLSRLHRYLPRSRINPILISELIALSGDTPETWFRHYTRIILKPVLAMYLIYGVALEAHQQNTQVLFDDSGRAVPCLSVTSVMAAAGPRHSVSRVTNSNLISGTAFYPRCLKMILNPSEPSSWMLALSVICMKSPFA